MQRTDTVNGAASAETFTEFFREWNPGISRTVTVNDNGQEFSANIVGIYYDGSIVITMVRIITDLILTFPLGERITVTTEENVMTIVQGARTVTITK